MAFVLGMVISNPFSEGRNLEKSVSDIERGIRFMNDESAVRNVITRLHLFLNKDPQEYAVEYGPSSQFVLPAKEEDEYKILTKEEQAQKEKEQKDLNMKFGRITEFQDSNMSLENDVKVIAVGNAQTNKLQTKGEFSQYAYPSGEKDETFFVLAENDAIATIATSAFASKIEHNYYHLDKTSEKDLNAAQDKKAKELFDEWLKNSKKN